MRLRDVGEFGLIGRIEALARAASGGRPRPRPVVLGIGDDAALLRARRDATWAVTTDAHVEGVHFRWPEQGPRDLGRRIAAANLSDLAAMGAAPAALTLSLAAPPDLELRTLLGVVRGLLATAAAEGAELVGGNVARAARSAFHVTALGTVPRGGALLRRAARPGDRLFVTGVLGATALDRARAEASGGRLRHRPEARVGAGRALRRLPTRGACIDVSDGLLADLGHVLEASGVGVELDVAALPRPRGLAAACRRLGLVPEAVLLGGGEDYELLFTLRAKGPGPRALSRRLGVPVREIGRITRSRGRVLLGAPAGAAGGGGWRHF